MLTLHHNVYSPHIIQSKKSVQLIDIFSAWTGERAISLESESDLIYLFIATDICDVTLTFHTVAPHTKVTIYGLCLANQESDINVKLHTLLHHDSSIANIHLVTFITEWWKCSLDGKIVLGENIHQWVGHLLEENVLLGDKIQIKTLPMLDVRSSDVQATHGATIQRLDSDKLFYLTSKGISPYEAKRMMISSYFDKLFESFGEQQEVGDLKEKYLAQLLEQV